MEVYAWIDQRKGSISIRGMEWDDIRQIVALRVWTNYRHFDPAKGPFGPWVNRVISNALRNIWRDEIGQWVRPCLRLNQPRKARCPHNAGGDQCSKTPSGLQCDECPLFRAWQTSHAGTRYSIRVPDSIEVPALKTEDTFVNASKENCGSAETDDFDFETAEFVIQHLAAGDRELIEGVLAFGGNVSGCCVANGYKYPTTNRRVRRLYKRMARMYSLRKELKRQHE